MKQATDSCAELRAMISALMFEHGFDLLASSTGGLIENT